MQLFAHALPSDAALEIWASEMAVDSFTFLGAKTGHPAIFVVLLRDRLIASSSLPVLTEHLIAKSIELTLNPWSVSQFLRNSYVPVPYTIFEHVYVLGCGDRLTVTASPDLTRTTELHHAFPFFSSASRGDSPTTTDAFRREMAAAVQRAAGGFADRVLMLSAGPDSSAIALGIADNGFSHVRCLTYAAGTKADENEAAAALCRRLGLKHETIALANADSQTAETLLAFYAKSLFPCSDPALVPYVVCLRQANVTTGVCLDGLGLYLYGQEPSRAERIKLRCNLNRSLGFASHLVPHYLRMSWFTNSEIDVFIRAYNMKPEWIKKIYEPAVDTEKYWTETVHTLSSYDLIDYSAALRGRHLEQARYLQKARLATSAQNVVAAFPWKDLIFGEYIFNLPEQCRFNRGSKVNKSFCLAVLRESTKLNTFRHGGFQFDLTNFCTQWRDFIYAEVLGCTLWTRTVEPVLDRLYRALPRHRFAAVSIHDVFQLSAWVNHNSLRIRC